MEEKLEKIEEWKVVRSTIVEFDHILSNIRSLDITATIVILGFAFQYSSVIFLLASAFNFFLLLLEIHYHKYLHEIADYAIELEEEIGFKLTHKLSSARNEYRNQDGFTYVIGYLIANIYYCIYIGFMIIGLVLFSLISLGHYIR
jgi:hypothetical protein